MIRALRGDLPCLHARSVGVQPSDPWTLRDALRFLLTMRRTVARSPRTDAVNKSWTPSDCRPMACISMRSPLHAARYSILFSQWVGWGDAVAPARGVREDTTWFLPLPSDRKKMRELELLPTHKKTPSGWCVCVCVRGTRSGWGRCGGWSAGDAVGRDA